jgi:hypothetical protein
MKQEILKLLLEEALARYRNKMMDNFFPDPSTVTNINGGTFNL